MKFSFMMKLSITKLSNEMTPYIIVSWQEPPEETLRIEADIENEPLLFEARKEAEDFVRRVLIPAWPIRTFQIVRLAEKGETMITADRVCAFLRKDRRTIYRWLRSGKFKKAHKAGKSWLFDTEEVLSLRPESITFFWKIETPSGPLEMLFFSEKEAKKYAERVKLGDYKVVRGG